METKTPHNIEREREWTAILRTTEMPQAKETLVKVEPSTGEVIGMCCLGIGEIKCAGQAFTLRRIDYDGDTVDDGDDETTVTHYIPVVDGAEEPDLPTAFLTWLGFDETSFMDSVGDPMLDVPECYPRRHMLANGRETTSYDTVTCAMLNDGWSLTFPQIADMVDYFGLSGVKS